MVPERSPFRAILFPTSLGWMGFVCSGDTVRHLTFGHPDADSAMASLKKRGVFQESIWVTCLSGPDCLRKLQDQTVESSEVGISWQAELVDRLQAYAAGQIVGFNDVAVDPGPTTPFQARVYAVCRQIPYGQTITYGQLAQRVGSPKAARAVGQCLAHNPIPIVIPCHRVVGVGGQLIGFTAPGGLAMKKRLLQLESSKTSGGKSSTARIEEYFLKRVVE